MGTTASRAAAHTARAIASAALALAGAVAWSAAPVAVPFALAAPPPPVFTGDVNTAPMGSAPSEFAVSGGRLFFVADDGVHGEELWVTTGTGVPTLIDINPTGGSFPRNLTDVDGTLWFSASNGTDGSEPWTSNGGPVGAGTAMVANVNAGAGNSTPNSFVSFDGAVHFSADDGLTGIELWRSDGSAVGTSRVADLRPGPGSSSPAELVVIEYPAAPAEPSRLWFSAAAVNATRDLVSLDDQGAVTTELTDRVPSELVAIGEALFYRARTTVGSVPESLHTTTRSGAVFTSTSLGGSPFNLTVFLGQLYFTNNAAGTTGQELSTWTGTEIAVVKDIVSGAGSSAPASLTAAGATLYFVADVGGIGGTGAELWRTDGTELGTTLVADIEPGIGGSLPSELLVGPGGRLIFSARTTANGREPWAYTGTGVPFLIEDVHPGAGDSEPADFRLLPGAGVFFAATDPAVGSEPMRWQSPFTAGTVTPFADLRTDTQSSFPEGAVAVGNRVVWAAGDELVGTEPIVYGLGGATASVLSDVRPGGPLDDSVPLSFTPLGPTALFTAADGVHGVELWRTDATAGGTVLVEDIRPGPDGSDAEDLVVWNGIAYFRADDGAAGYELWRSDGTAAGTFRIADIEPGPDGSDPSRFTPLGSHLYFTASLPDGEHLWRTDGTTAGTAEVDTIDEPTGVDQLAATAAGLLMFRAFDPASGEFVLWRSDGTAAGTSVVPDTAGIFGANPFQVTASGDRVYFFADRSDDGLLGLWVSNGTSTGTIELRHGIVTTGDGMAALPAGGVLVPFADVTNGLELWRTRGLPGDTTLLADFIPGAGSGEPARLTPLNGWVYMIASTTAHGAELWRSDGVVTERVTDLLPGAGDGLDRSVAMWVASDRLWFPGTDTAHGREMWFVADVPPAPPAPAAPNAAAGPASATVSWTAVMAPTYAPITQYTVTAAPGGSTCTTASVTCVVTGLTPGTSYTFTVVATNRIASSPPSAASNAVVVTAPPVVTVQPARLLETRVGEDFDTVDGLFQGIGRQPAGATVALTVTGRGNVPAGAAAVMLNVTAVFPGGAGFLTVFPCGEDRPNASSVNYQPGQVVPNAVLAKVGAAGQVCIFTTAAADLLVDVNGYVPAGGSPSTVSPGRLLDTRSGPGIETVDGLFVGGGRQPAGATAAVTVTGRGDVPAGATAVMLNVTAVVPDGPGFLTVFPCGEDRPNASSVNYQRGQVVPNAVLAQVGTGGQVCIFTTSAADLLVDVSGFVPAGSAPTPVVPARLLETRSGVGFDTVDGAFEGIGRRVAGSVLELPVTGRGNVPSGAASVMVNVTAVVPDGPGFLTVFPCGQPQPLASSVNYQGGQVVPNAVLAKIGTGGRICIFTTSDTDLLVDVTGWT